MLVAAFKLCIGLLRTNVTHTALPPETDPFSKVPAADTHAEPDNNSYMDEI
jgi:hypothetical protein